MVKIILIKSPVQWATTKQACRDDLVVYLIFLPQHILRSASMYSALFYEDQFYTSTAAKAIHDSS